MKRKLNILSILLTAALLLTGSCKKALDENLKKSLTPDNYFNTPQDAVNAVNGVYVVFQDNYVYSQELSFVLNFGNDEILTAENTINSTMFQETYTMNPSNLDRVTFTWGRLWTAVKNANFAIDGSAKITTTTADQAKLVKRVAAEAKFLRALAYLNLTQLWGDLPKMDKSASTIEATLALPKTPAKDIRNFIKDDLIAAAIDLPLKKEYATEDGGRASRGAALALLAKMYLFDKQWDKAAEVTSQIMASAQYDLNPNMEKNFEQASENGVESIFEFQYAKDLRSNHFGGDYGGTYVPSKKLINAYQPGDLRKTLYLSNIKFREGLPDNRYYFRKYAWDPSTPYTYYNEGINLVILRYADVLLMNAEALNELGRTAEAITQINKVRDRAHATLIDQNTSTAAVRQLIMNERFMELCGEMWRRFDLVRWGILVPTIKAFAAENPKGAANISDKNILYPIPVSEINLYPNLLPNNGY